MDRLEANHEALAREVGQLTGTVARVEMNQTHQAELNKLRFDSLDTSINGVSGTLDRFMQRINGIVSGEIRLPAAIAGEEMVKDYRIWRDNVDARLDNQDVVNGQIRLLGRLAALLVSSNIIAIIAAVYALIK